MRWIAVAIALAPACFNPKYNNPTCGPNGECPPDLTCVAGTCRGPEGDDAGPDDAEVDSSRLIDVNPMICQGSGTWQVCPAMMPTTVTTLTAATIDTATSPLCEVGAGFTSSAQPDACVITGTNITVAGTVTARGTRPLVLFATGTISVGGSSILDVGSHRVGGAGAGAGTLPTGGCNAFTATPGAASEGGGGGAGGSFMTVGAGGGIGGKSAAAAGQPALALAAAPSVLRGGCNGQTGGASLLVGGPPGAGGGAVFFIASTIALDGSINASGAGSTVSNAIAGGGGGGSGGMIVLQATTFTGTGKLAANGGGGAGGGGSTQGSFGSDGSATTLTVPATGGSGGAGNTCGQNATGGAGFAGSTAASVGLAGNSGGQCGGGGGGGGGGYIRSNGAVGNTVASPAVTIVP